MLFTAGSDNQCTEAADLEPVAESTVRLMNVAFSPESDAELDELASETNGISYTVETSNFTLGSEDSYFATYWKPKAVEKPKGLVFIWYVL